MKMLFIVQSFLPYGGAVNKLLLNLFKSSTFRNNNIEVDVLTLKGNVNDKTQERIEGITVNRLEYVASSSLKNILEIKNKILLPYLLQLKIKSHFDGKKPVGSIDTGMVNQIYKYLSSEGVRYDKVITVNGRTEMLCGFMKYAQEHNRYDAGVLYQVDPIADNVAYDGEMHKQLNQIEREAYHKMGCIVTTPIIHKANTMHGYTVRRAFPLEFPTMQAERVRRDVASVKKYGCTKFLFTGYLHEKLRSPEYTLAMFAKLNIDFELDIIGRGYEQMIRRFEEGPLKGRLVNWGQQLPNVVDNEQENADVLVNIGNACDNMVPSKIFEYISLGKPIINICKIKGCPTLSYMEKYPLALNLFEDSALIDEQAAIIEKFVAETSGKRLLYSEIVEVFPECQVENVANEFLNTVLLVAPNIAINA